MKTFVEGEPKESLLDAGIKLKIEAESREWEGAF